MTLSVGLLWMASNTTAGIMYGYAFVEGKIKTGNIIYYIWFVTSLGLFLWYEYRLWTKPIEAGDETDSDKN
ncbi:hypothetical protein [Foetidibacter luteolus]|uniref:hypothetical protein n=1 Tax=Foetidibacter luteolus TaxID=2608880 RepID=UPI00129B121E|nr:hypothetical protein [Foetidibacter luteolus]